MTPIVVELEVIAVPGPSSKTHLPHAKNGDKQAATDAHNPRAGLVRSLGWPVVILVLSTLGWLVVISAKTPTPDRVQSPPLISSNVQNERRGEFYQANIEPLLLASERANQEAANRAVQRIEDSLSRYRRGIEPFTEDITAIGTRLGILRRMPAAWWYEDDRIEKYVQKKFEKHLFSQNALNSDIANALQAFRDDLIANRNRALTNVRSAVEASDLPDIAVPDFASYENDILAIMAQFSSERGTDSVYNGIATLVASETAAVVIEQIIVRLLASVGSAAASSAAGAGGATAGGAAAGGATGTLAGPVGTAIGVGVGMVVGVIIDWWMTERFQDELTHDLQNYFDSLQSALLDGTSEEPGLRPVLDRFCDDLSCAQSTVLHRSLVGGPQ